MKDEIFCSSMSSEIIFVDSRISYLCFGWCCGLIFGTPHCIYLDKFSELAIHVYLV